MIDYSVQTLITTVNVADVYQLLDSMNIRTSFLVGNQCDTDLSENIRFREIDGILYNRNSRGVGRNRNVLIENATSDICVFADDDMYFYDDAEQKVISAFNQHQDADVIIFNLDESSQQRRVNQKPTRINISNYMNYGAARIAFRRQAVSYHGILFNDNFGGGTRHQCGEDSLFLRACLKSKLRVIAIPVTLAKLLDNRESTWFEGYSDKYLFDKGVFLALAHPCLAVIFGLYLALRHREYISERKNQWAVFVQINRGIKFIKSKDYLYGYPKDE